MSMQHAAQNTRPSIGLIQYIKGNKLLLFNIPIKLSREWKSKALTPRAMLKDVVVRWGFNFSLQASTSVLILLVVLEIKASKEELYATKREEKTLDFL